MSVSCIMRGYSLTNILLLNFVLPPAAPLDPASLRIQFHIHSLSAYWQMLACSCRSFRIWYLSFLSRPFLSRVTLGLSLVTCLPEGEVKVGVRWAHAALQARGLFSIFKQQDAAAFNRKYGTFCRPREFGKSRDSGFSGTSIQMSHSESQGPTFSQTKL